MAMYIALYLPIVMLFLLGLFGLAFVAPPDAEERWARRERRLAQLLPHISPTLVVAAVALVIVASAAGFYARGLVG